MGTPETCKLCNLPVLELEGQFESLSPYIDGSQDNPAAFALVGEIHTKCLIASPYGPQWHTWHLQHFKVRGYKTLGVAEGWTVLGTPRTRDRFALHEHGASVGLERTQTLGRARDGFARARVIATDTHITIQDREYVAGVQARLAKEKEIPLAVLVDHFGIRDKLLWPDVLETARWVFSRRLRRDWEEAQVSAEWHYDIGIPEVVVEIWAAAGNT